MKRGFRRKSFEHYSRKKVVHIISGLEDGGAQSILFRISTNDSSCDHVVVSLGGDGKYGELLRSNSVQVVCLNMPRGRITFSGISYLWRFLRLERPDVIQTWMYHADFLGGITGRLAGCKNVIWNIRHSDLVPGANAKLTILISKICALVSGFVPRKIICCAHAAKKVHVNYGYSKNRMVVVQNGLDPDIYYYNPTAREQIRANWGLALSEIAIGLVARYDPQKDHGTFLEALAILKNREMSPKCFFVGTGMTNQNNELMEKISKLGLQNEINLIGRNNDVPGIMSALDINVLSSSHGEGFPNVLAEAMACETPCVSTDVGDAAFILGKNGILVSPGDPNALASGVEQMIREKESDSWGGRCVEARKIVVNNFSVNNMVAKYHEVWFD